MKLERIKNEQLELGNIVYSEYTEQYYIVSSLPRIIKEGISKFALVRLDGQGYFYLSDSIEDIIKKMNMDGGETEAYKVIEYGITL